MFKRRVGATLVPSCMLALAVLATPRRLVGGAGVHSVSVHLPFMSCLWSNVAARLTWPACGYFVAHGLVIMASFCSPPYVTACTAWGLRRVICMGVVLGRAAMYLRSLAGGARGVCVCSLSVYVVLVVSGGCTSHMAASGRLASCKASVSVHRPITTGAGCCTWLGGEVRPSASIHRCVKRSDAGRILTLPNMCLPEQGGAVIKPSTVLQTENMATRPYRKQTAFKLQCAENKRFAIGRLRERVATGQLHGSPGRPRGGVAQGPYADFERGIVPTSRVCPHGVFHCYSAVDSISLQSWCPWGARVSCAHIVHVLNPHVSVPCALPAVDLSAMALRPHMCDRDAATAGIAVAQRLPTVVEWARLDSQAAEERILQDASASPFRAPAINRIPRCGLDPLSRFSSVGVARNARRNSAKAAFVRADLCEGRPLGVPETRLQHTCYDVGYTFPYQDDRVDVRLLQLLRDVAHLLHAGAFEEREPPSRVKVHPVTVERPRPHGHCSSRGSSGAVRVGLCTSRSPGYPAQAQCCSKAMARCCRVWAGTSVGPALDV